jgi:Transposase DDE domain
MRKRVEELFGEAKECMGLRRMKFRGALFVREQVLLTATAQNIKRMVRLLTRMRPKRKAQTQALLPVTALPILLYLLNQRIFYPYDRDHPALPATT